MLFLDTYVYLSARLSFVIVTRNASFAGGGGREGGRGGERDGWAVGSAAAVNQGPPPSLIRKEVNSKGIKIIRAMYREIKREP